jgi:hypothetical protein
VVRIRRYVRETDSFEDVSPPIRRHKQELSPFRCSGTGRQGRLNTLASTRARNAVRMTCSSRSRPPKKTTRRIDP